MTTKFNTIIIISITPSATPPYKYLSSSVFPFIPKNEHTIPIYINKFVTAAITSLNTKENINEPNPIKIENDIPSPFKKLSIDADVLIHPINILV